MKYQFVDCRWELGKPSRGRELYLGGHIPGASFLDVDTDLSSSPGPRGRHPLPDPEQFAGCGCHVETSTVLLWRRLRKNAIFRPSGDQVG